MIGMLRRGPSALAGICIGVALVAASTGVLKAAGSSANRGTAAVILVLPVVVAGMIGGRGAALFPAATAYVTPSATERATASSSVGDDAPPRLMFATAGWPGWCCAVTQSMPQMTCASVPLPWEFTTLTA